MPTYVITGVSRGLGFEMLRALSSNPSNTVVGLVRNKAATEAKVAEELKDAPGKIHILATDLDSYDSIKNAAAETAAITGGAIDYLIANAAYVLTGSDFFKPIGTLAEDPVKLEEVLNQMIKTNLTGNIFLYSLFMPLILKGETKKVVVITSGLAELETCNKLELEVSPLYTMSKAAMNLATSKFSAQYKKDGVLFIGICPGMVDHGDGIDASKLSEAELAQAMGLFGKFAALSSDFKGPSTATETIPKVIKVWEEASIEKGDAGAFLAHTGIPGKWL